MRNPNFLAALDRLTGGARTRRNRIECVLLELACRDLGVCGRGRVQRQINGEFPPIPEVPSGSFPEGCRRVTRASRKGGELTSLNCALDGGHYHK